MDALVACEEAGDAYQHKEKQASKGARTRRAHSGLRRACRGLAEASENTLQLQVDIYMVVRGFKAHQMRAAADPLPGASMAFSIMHFRKIFWQPSQPTRMDDSARGGRFLQCAQPSQTTKEYFY